MKDHEIAKLVGELTDTAKEYGQTQQVRERIAGLVVGPLKVGEAALEALRASIGLMEQLPTLNGLYGLAVLEHAKEVVELSPITETVIDVVIHCPECGLLHVDAPTPGWANPPHSTHLCMACGHLWRPCAARTNGVARLPGMPRAPRLVRDAARWQYTQNPGYFVLPPSTDIDMWAVGIGTPKAENCFLGRTLAGAIDRALAMRGDR